MSLKLYIHHHTHLVMGQSPPYTALGHMTGQNNKKSTETGETPGLEILAALVSQPWN